MEKGRNLSDRVEQVVPLEERLGVSLSAIGAYVRTDADGRAISVAGEIRPQRGTRLEQDLEVVVTVYDEKRRVIGTGSHKVYRKTFWTFETFGLDLFGIPRDTEVARIRVFPKGT